MNLKLRPKHHHPLLWPGSTVKRVVIGESIKKAKSSGSRLHILLRKVFVSIREEGVPNDREGLGFQYGSWAHSCFGVCYVFWGVEPWRGEERGSNGRWEGGDVRHNALLAADCSRPLPQHNILNLCSQKHRIATIRSGVIRGNSNRAKRYEGASKDSFFSCVTIDILGRIKY